MKKIFFMIVVLVGIFSIVGCEKNEEYSGKKVENSRELNENEITDLMNVIDDLFYIDGIFRASVFIHKRKRRRFNCRKWAKR